MKRIILILSATLLALPGISQLKIEKSFPFTGKESVKLDIQISDSINIETWDKNEVFINASVNINDNKDNDAYETSFNETGKVLIVKAGFKDDYFRGKKNNCVESRIFWQVYVPRGVSLNVESINADITITGDTGPLNIKSISGFIDLAVPEKRSADIDLSTISGTIYSNHNFPVQTREKSGMPHIENRLNSGGELIKLATISGDIFLRKSE